MDESENWKLPKESKGKHRSEAEEIRELAFSITEASIKKSLELEDPLDEYAHQLKIHWQLDAKTFSDRLINGYEVLLEELSSTSSENSSKND